MNDLDTTLAITMSLAKDKSLISDQEIKFLNQTFIECYERKFETFTLSYEDNFQYMMEHMDILGDRKST